MSEQEANASEREELRKLFLDHPSASMPALIEFNSAVPEDVQDVDAFIDRILAAGYRKPEITDGSVLRFLNATVRPDQAAPDLTYWGDSTVAQTRAALGAALRVPVEGEAR